MLDFPASPTLNQQYTGPDGSLWSWDGVKWVAIGSTSSGGGIPDAPSDGAHYGRFNALWSAVLAISGDVLDGGNF